MKLAKLGMAGSSSSSSGGSMSSSLTSSMSTGGSMSPSQDRVDHLPPQRLHQNPSSGISGIQQMLPLKLSENSSENKSRMTSGYQRLSSPPLTMVEASGGPAHQRTGSSPASLQNGSPTSQGHGNANIYTSQVSGHHNTAQPNPRAVRTNTYPKISNKPTVTATRAASEASRTGEAPTFDPSSNARPGQRVRDPDSNQDILFL